MADDRKKQLAASAPLLKRTTLTIGEATDAMLPPGQTTSALVPAADGSIRVGSSLLTHTGISFPADLSEDEWQRVGKALFGINSAMQWWLGDWLNAYRPGWGAMYDEAAELTGLTKDTLSNVASVCAKVQLPFRNGNLSFTHHTAVSSLTPEQQIEYLAAAERDKLSVSKLRRLIEGKPPKKVRQGLANRKYYTTFKRVWKGVEAGDPNKVSLKDIDNAIEWLGHVRQAKIEMEGSAQ